jgi:hypothetical protein
METEVPELLRRHQQVSAQRFTCHSRRVAMREVTPAKLARMNRDSDRCAAELADARCDVLAYACLVAVMAEVARAHVAAEQSLAAAAGRTGGRATSCRSSAARERSSSGWTCCLDVHPRSEDGGALPAASVPVCPSVRDQSGSRHRCTFGARVGYATEVVSVWITLRYYWRPRLPHLAGQRQRCPPPASAPAQ